MNSKIKEYEEKIKLSDLYNKKIFDEKENIISEYSRQIHNLNSNVSTLEGTVNNLKNENSEKANKIKITENELAEAYKNMNGIKIKYESLTEKMEKEYNSKNVKKTLFLLNLLFILERT